MNMASGFMGAYSYIDASVASGMSDDDLLRLVEQCLKTGEEVNQAENERSRELSKEHSKEVGKTKGDKKNPQ